MQELKIILEQRLFSLKESIKSSNDRKSYDSTLELRIARKDELQFVLNVIHGLEA